MTRRLPGLALTVALAAAAVKPGPILDKVPAKPAADVRYLIYLHGKVVEDLGRRPTRAPWGVYEYDQILAALAEGGATVISEQRPANTDMDEFAAHVAGQVKQLEAGGAPPEHITVVGFSKGGLIAIRTSALLKDPRLNFVFLAACVDGDSDSLAHPVAGRILSIYEANDDVGRSCTDLFTRPGFSGKHSEIRVAVGDHHGTFFRVHREWVSPLLGWVETAGPAAAARP